MSDIVAFDKSATRCYSENFVTKCGIVVTLCGRSNLKIKIRQ